MAKGYLIVNVYSGSIANPVKNATVTISKDDLMITTVKTNEDGQTEPITLETVSKSYSEEEQYQVRPYEVYDVTVTALGLTKTKIEGVQIFDSITSVQNVFMTSIDENQEENVDQVTDNTLWKTYPPNISVPSTDTNSGIALAILREVLIPENIIVHDGTPSNSNASNYTVPFIDYIKNVASSEIYSTWPEETIKANVIAIISFTLNRIYTEWYRNKGYNFTITSTTSYDQKYTRNGTIFEPISQIVDNIFREYIREGIRVEPLLAHYKSETNEKGYLSQWGSKRLGDQGYSALDILRYYYGKNTNIYEAKATTSYPYSFTNNLEKGDCGSDVYVLQNTLNYIRGSYPGIPLIENPTGLYNEATSQAVRKFQDVFNLSETGIVDYSTWYKMSYILTAVTDMTNSIYN